jgi:hypothetical protein
MRRKEVEIKDAGGVKVGAVIFDESPAQLNITRTATGINLTIPTEVELRWPKRDEPRPTLTNLRVVVSMRDRSGSETEICRIRDDNFYEAASPSKTSPAQLIWTDALRGLIFIEGRRAEKQAEFIIWVYGELGYIVRCAETPNPDDNRVIVHPLRYDVRTAPRVYIAERTYISYPVDIWEKMSLTAFEASQDDPYLLSLPLHSFLKQKS